MSKQHHSHLAKSLGAYIFKTRTDKEIMQYELANKLDMTGQFLGRIEKGAVMIPEESLLTAIRVLKLKPTHLVNIFKNASIQDARDLIAKAKANA